MKNFHRSLISCFSMFEERRTLPSRQCLASFAKQFKLLLGFVILTRFCFTPRSYWVSIGPTKPSSLDTRPSDTFSKRQTFESPAERYCRSLEVLLNRNRLMRMTFMGKRNFSPWRFCHFSFQGLECRRKGEVRLWVAWFRFFRLYSWLEMQINPLEKPPTQRPLAAAINAQFNSFN